MSNNNKIIPTITFDNCFQFLSKTEKFENTYCQFCGQIVNSNYKEYLYVMPNYLIIILNRGKGNIFNCNVQIPEMFCPSNYVINEKNSYFNLIGVVSHFGESGMEDHFIAFCKHNIDGKWRCFNDSIVTESPNDYLQRGTPYILFYQKEKFDNSLQNNQGKNNGIMNINQININNPSINIPNLFNNNNQNINIISNNNIMKNQNMGNKNNFLKNYNMNIINNNIFQQNMNINNNNPKLNINFNNFQPNLNIINNQNMISINKFQQNINNNNNIKKEIK